MAGPMPGGKRFVRYLLAGAANTLFGFAAYTGLILGGAPVWLALLLATVLGIVFNFFSTGGFVFGNRGMARLPHFVICYGVVYAINLAAVESLMACCAPGRKITAQAVVTLPVALLAYYLLKSFVFAAPKSQRTGIE